MDIDIYGIPADKIDEAWDTIEPYITPALKYNDTGMTSLDVYEMIRRGSVLPIIMSHEDEIMSVVTLEISEEKAGKVLYLMTSAGTRIDDWLDEFMQVADILAKEQGCSRIIIKGRKGWLKKMKRYGFDHAYTAITKRLN